MLAVASRFDRLDSAVGAEGSMVVSYVPAVSEYGNRRDGGLHPPFPGDPYRPPCPVRRTAFDGAIRIAAPSSMAVTCDFAAGGVFA
jgi:hypothetical protein